MGSESVMSSYLVGFIGFLVGLVRAWIRQKFLLIAVEAIVETLVSVLPNQSRLGPP